MRRAVMAAALLAAAVFAGPVLAEEAAPAKPGQWQVLFDGKNLNAWDYKPAAWKIQEDGSLYTPGRGGDIFSKQKFQDFVLDLEFKVTKGCNSGVFVRMADRRDWLHSSIEFQVLDSYGKKRVGKHDCGAMYDCKAPDHNASKPVGQWNRMQITCFKNRIWVALNGVQIQDIDLNEWDTARENPDGTKNKFRDPVKKIQHAGYLALQTHGRPLWFRSVKVKVLDAAKPMAKCPGCGKAGPEGWYCAKCNAVCTTCGKFQCKKNADKMMTAGTYCPKANRFRFAPDAPKCPKCERSKGQWCPKCKAYVMTAGVTYDEQAKKPVAKTPKHLATK